MMDDNDQPMQPPEPPAAPEPPSAPEPPQPAPQAAVPPPPPAPQVATSPTPSAAAKADLGKRFVAILIDGIISGVVGLIPVIGGLVGAAYMLVRDGLELDFMDYRSIGKKVMKLRPVRVDGQTMDISASIKRNIPFAIGPVIMVIPVLGWVLGPIVAIIIGIIESILVLTDAEGRRMGDKLADTKVIEVSD